VAVLLGQQQQIIPLETVPRKLVPFLLS